MSRQALIRKHLQLRADMIRLIRNYFHENGYLEVETPIRIPSPAPESNIEPVKSDGWYLQTSPELCMKQLLASGYEKIFQIARAFRKNERGNKHIPELTLLEWYTKGDSYTDLMDQCESLVQHIAENLNCLNSFSYQNQTISLHCPWDKLTVTEAFSRYSDTTVRQALADNRFDEIMGLEIEPQLGKSKPLFLYDYPCELAALARKKKSDPLVAERFELYIAGLELCNGFSELTDPVEQRTRFRQEMNNRKESRLDTWDMPENFLEALHFMPEAAGIALGIDRLVMLFADTQNIADVVAFTPEDLTG